MVATSTATTDAPPKDDPTQPLAFLQQLRRLHSLATQIKNTMALLVSVSEGNPPGPTGKVEH